MSRNQNISVTSLGMTILDELRIPSRETLEDVPGGSGLYATLGARLVTPSARSQSVGYLLLTGRDFPDTILDLFRGWNLNLHVQTRSDEPSTRGLLEYHDAGLHHKSFRYLTSPLQPWPSDLVGTPLLLSHAFHILASPFNMETHVSSLSSLREEHDSVHEPPLIIWEPMPMVCNREHLESHLESCRRVDVFSPNHMELTALFEDDGKQSGLQPAEFSRKVIEGYATRFRDAMIKSESTRGLVVVRCGEHGCLIFSRHAGPAWFPAYHAPGSVKVKDATGAGNAFLGGLAVGLLETEGDLREAVVYGSVAASFVVEQIGLPLFRPTTPMANETWNGVAVAQRLKEYRQMAE